MAKYRMKTFVDAVQWMGDNLNDVAPIFEGGQFSVHYASDRAHRRLTFCDAEAEPIDVRVGEWIVRDCGQLLVFKAADFEHRFERLARAPGALEQAAP